MYSFLLRPYILKMKLSDSDIRKQITVLRKKYGKIYAPLKYFRGLETAKQIETRYKKMLQKNYEPFETDKNIATKPSNYTKRFKKIYGEHVVTLPQIAKATGIPLSTITIIYNRGLAAWRTGHRPGASPQAWGYARVHSFATKGKTYYTADKDLHQ